MTDAIAFQIERQRTPTDCSVCCAAMALRLPYGVVLSTAKALGHEAGWDGEAFEEVFDELGFAITQQPRVFRPRYAAILSVPSRINEGGFHAVYYEAGMLFDPTVSVQSYSLGEALHAAHSFYQWSPIREGQHVA